MNEEWKDLRKFNEEWEDLRKFIEEELKKMGFSEKQIDEMFKYNELGLEFQKDEISGEEIVNIGCLFIE